MKRYVVCLLIISFVVGCQSNQSKVEPIEAIDHKYKFSNQITEEFESSDQPWRFQLAGTDHSYIGNEEQTEAYFYKNSSEKEPMNDSLFAEFQNKYKAVTAADYILERAEKEQIVIINEAHHRPKHRVLTASLLQDLYAIGYRYFGAETLGEGDIDSLNIRKYPTYKSGVYSDEPQFGDLIREALKIGYKLFPYEGDGSGKEREINQAKNIKKFIEKHTDGKVLIHCGYQHAQEGMIEGAWGKAMAGRLLEFTRINPLTVNQTRFDNRLNSKLLKPLQQRISINQPTVFINKKSNLSFQGEVVTDGFDITIFHEQSTYENDRPTWLTSNGKKWVEVDLDEVNLPLPYFVFAFVEGEDFTKAIPLDLLEITEDVDEVNLALRTGRYKIIVQNREKKAKTFSLSVE